MEEIEQIGVRADYLYKEKAAAMGVTRTGSVSQRPRATLSKDLPRKG